MADKQVIVKAKIETEGIGTLSKELDGVTQATEGVTVAAKGADTAFEGTSDAVRSVGYALKAAGIGLIMAGIALAVQAVTGAFGMLTDAFMKNQVVSDKYEKTVGAINAIIDELLDKYVALVIEFYSASERFPAITKHMENFGQVVGTATASAVNSLELLINAFGLIKEVITQIVNFDFNFDKIKTEAADLGKSLLSQFNLVGEFGGAVLKTAKGYPDALGEMAGAYGEFAMDITQIDLKQRIASQKTEAQLIAEMEAEERLAAARVKAREKRLADNKAMYDFFKELRKDNAQAEFSNNKKLLDDLRRKHNAERKMLEDADIHKNKRGQVQKELEDRQERELQELKDTLRNENLLKQQTEADTLLAIQNETTLLLIEDLQERALKELEIQKEKELKALEGFENFKELEEAINKKYEIKASKLQKKKEDGEVKMTKMTQDQKLTVAQDTAGSMAKLMGEETAAGKAFAVVQATIDTYRGATAAIASFSSMGPVGVAAGAIAAAGIVASGIANVNAILSAGEGGGGSISANTPSSGGGQPTPQMMGGAFEVGAIEPPEPVKAFVVTDEMTNSQDQLANIRRRATI